MSAARKSARDTTRKGSGQRGKAAARPKTTTSRSKTPRSPYDALPQVAANYAPLTPLAFLSRTAMVWPDRLAVVHGERRFTWAEVHERVPALGLGAALARHRPRRHRRDDAAEHSAACTKRTSACR